MTVARFSAGLIACLFFLQVRRIQHHQPGQFTRGRRGDDLALEATFAQQGNAPAVIQVGMGQQEEIDTCGIKTEIIGIFLVELASALIQTAVDQDPAAGTFDQMAGAGYAAVCTVKGNLHVILRFLPPVFIETHEPDKSTTSVPGDR